MLRTLLAVILALAVSAAGAQIVNRPVAAGAISNPGTSLPATCAVGYVYFKSNSTAGQNLHLCTAANTWTQMTGGNLANPVTPAQGGSGAANSKNLTWSNSLTLAGTDATTMTFPSTSATIARTDAANTFTGAQTVRAAATQDSVALQGRAGGTSSFIATITPTTLTASRTITIPDAAITMARSDAAQTFTGIQTFTNGINLGSSNLTTYTTSSFTVTLTGCGSATTGTALYSEVGNMIIVEYPSLTCTSNATTKTLTGAPGALGPATAKGGLMAIVQDNGGAFAVGLATVGSGTGVVTLSKDVGGTAFTASGTFTLKQTTLVYTAQ